MPWTIEFTAAAERQLAGLGRESARRIVKTLETRIAVLADPRSIGKALSGEWRHHWRWRIGDYRVIARIEDGTMVIVVVQVGHRREVYR